jgi:2-polyprenyl-3-methyl-5-hydroxy-6-metoxy-1,4-benzoquinol methylase
VYPDSEFMVEMAALEAAYLRSDDPMVQSGFRGGRARWFAQRSPLLEAIDKDGDLLDVGCANGLLAADVVAWAAAERFRIVPYGVDLGEQLIGLARRRLPESAANFAVADAWTWQPQRQWTFVYSLLDLSPVDLRCQWLRRLYDWVAPGGRLIVGSYGSRSRKEAPEPVADVLGQCGFDVAGSSAGGEGPITRFAWVAKPGATHQPE